jgi:hypothetical protein
MPDELAMKCLVLTTDDSGAGCLKGARIADKVVGFAHRLVCGPVPTISDPAAFFSARADMLRAETVNWSGWEDWAQENAASNFDRDWLELLATCRTSERVELWIDPVPNAQLLLVQLLDWFHLHTDFVGKLVLVHSDRPFGEQTSEEVMSMQPSRQRVENCHLETAKLAWDAFRQPTPEAWRDLLCKDLGALPYLHPSVLRLLEELPAAGTALGSTEMRLLNAVSDHDAVPPNVFRSYRRGDNLPVLNYWEIGLTLDQLAFCSTPAVEGLDEGPFTMALHDDRCRMERYRQSKLSLSELGRALVENRDDFSQHNSIRRWWGGTKLTNDHLWRWDAAENALISPR